MSSKRVKDLEDVIRRTIGGINAFLALWEDEEAKKDVLAIKQTLEQACVGAEKGVSKMSKERPIIFSGDMVRAILDGRKTQTRRVCKDQTAQEYKWVEKCEQYPSTLGETYTGWAKDCGLSFLLPTKCPYGVVGGRLWVRETWDFRAMGGELAANRIVIIGYRADGATKAVDVPLEHNPTVHRKWRSPYHLPKWAARIWLEITNIRVERVQEISIADCVEEGIQRIRGPLPPCPTTAFKDYSSETVECGATASFRTLWDSLNAKRSFGWDKNPYVWVIEFKRIEK